jgi:hypothetical protein
MEFLDRRNPSRERKIPLEELPRAAFSGGKINELEHVTSPMRRETQRSGRECRPAVTPRDDVKNPIKRVS